VPDLGLVLKMGNHLCLSWQSPDESSSVGCRVLLGRTQPDGGLVDVSGRFVDGFHQHFYESVDLIVVLVLVTDFKSVVEENVS